MVDSELNIRPSEMVPIKEGLEPISTGGSDFVMMRRLGYLTVDKTAMFPLLIAKWHVFISRPRRFGKSLLISQLKELFLHGAHSECFNGFAIQKLWQPQICEHVIMLDFSEMGRSHLTFEAELCQKLRTAFSEAGFAGAHEVAPQCSKFYIVSDALNELRGNAVLVFLIDEWDFPLSLHLSNETAFESNKHVINQFYSWLRGLESVRFTLVTGIGRYKDTSLFTGQYINDISMDPNFADLLGYTEADVKKYFGNYLSKAASLSNVTEQQLLKKLKYMYDGFCFDEDASLTLFCPLSINAFFSQIYNNHFAEKPKFYSYWVTSSNTPSILRSYLDSHNTDLSFFDNVKKNNVELLQDSFCSPKSFDQISFESILVQTGYLTIKEKVQAPTSDETDESDVFDDLEEPVSPISCSFKCNFTNIEIENLFIKVFVGFLTGSKESSADGMLISKARNIKPALLKCDFLTLVDVLNLFLRNLHYDIYKDADESKYRSMLAFFLRCGINPNMVWEEVPNSIGRADIEVLIGDSLFVFELKLAKASKHISNSSEEDNTPSKEEVDSYISLATILRMTKKAYNQIVRKGYGFGNTELAVKRWYGIVLVISEASHSICYWRAFTTRKNLGQGLIAATNIHNPPNSQAR